MVLRGNRNLVCLQILDGPVATTVTEFEFKCLRTERMRDNLVTKADSESRVVLDQVFNSRMRIATAAGSPGPFERKTPSGAHSRILQQ